MVAKREKVIVTCAVTGSIHTPSMSPYLPITPAEIARQGIDAAEAGAAILHLHARDPEDGRPASDPTLFNSILTGIRQGSSAVLNVTTGGGHNMSLAQRTQAAMEAAPEMCSLNMGSMNFGIFPAIGGRVEWKFAWERDYLEMTRDFIFRNTFKDIESIIAELGTARGCRFEFECYDVGHLHTLSHFYERGVVKPPLFIQMVFGILGGIGAMPTNFTHMKSVADALFGENYQFSVLAAGRHQMPFAVLSAINGGHVRVGLEDSIYIRKGELARSNASQVTKIRSILEELGFDIATPDHARDLLKLKGAAAVAF